MHGNYATSHFVHRAGERLGYTREEAYALAGRLIISIERGLEDHVQFVSRVDRNGCRLFRFQAVDSRHYYALVNTDNMRCITILPAGFEVPRQGNSVLKLKDVDL
jgi:hypothetical protein